MGVDERIARLPAPARPVVRLGLWSLTGLHRLRHPRTLRCGRGVVITGRLRLRQGTRLELGPGVRVRGRVVVNGGGLVRVGSGTLLNGCWIGASTEVVVGAGCLLSDCDVTDDDFHELDPERRHEPPGPRTRRPVVVGDNVWLGARSLVLKGSTVGTHSVVGAGSVVRGVVPAAVVVVGNPAVVVKRLRAPSPAD